MASNYREVSFLCECGKFHSVSIGHETIVGCAHCHTYYDCDPNGKGYSIQIEQEEAQVKLREIGVPYLISTGSDVLMESGRPANFFDGNALFDFVGLSRKTQALLLRSVYDAIAFSDLSAEMQKRTILALDSRVNSALGEYNLKFLKDTFPMLSRTNSMEQSHDRDAQKPIVHLGEKKSDSDSRLKAAICECGKIHFLNVKKPLVLFCQNCGRAYYDDGDTHSPFMERISDWVAEDAIARGFSLKILSGRGIPMQSGHDADYISLKGCCDFHGLSIGEDLFQVYRVSEGLSHSASKDLILRTKIDEKELKARFSEEERAILNEAFRSDHNV